MHVRRLRVPSLTCPTGRRAGYRAVVIKPRPRLFAVCREKLNEYLITTMSDTNLLIKAVSNFANYAQMIYCQQNFAIMQGRKRCAFSSRLEKYY